MRFIIVIVAIIISIPTYSYEPNSFDVRVSSSMLQYYAPGTPLVISEEESRRRGVYNQNGITLFPRGIKTRNEYYMILTHEIGHAYDIGYNNGKSKLLDKSYTDYGEPSFSIDDDSLDYYRISREGEYSRREQSQESFCTIYGMLDPFEDFAECFTLYLFYNSTFRYYASKNYYMLKKFEYMQSRFRPIVTGKVRTKIYKDTTLLYY